MSPSAESCSVELDTSERKKSLGELQTRDVQRAWEQREMGHGASCAPEVHEGLFCR